MGKKDSFGSTHLKFLYLKVLCFVHFKQMLQEADPRRIAFHKMVKSKR